MISSAHKLCLVLIMLLSTAMAVANTEDARIENEWNDPQLGKCFQSLKKFLGDDAVLFEEYDFEKESYPGEKPLGFDSKIRKFTVNNKTYFELYFGRDAGWKILRKTGKKKEVCLLLSIPLAELSLTYFNSSGDLVQAISNSGHPVDNSLGVLWFAAPPPGLLAARWRFHPRAFVEAFRKCGWLSLDELARTMPRHMFHTGPDTQRITTANQITLPQAIIRFTPYVNDINNCIRKYIGGDKKRIAFFLAQALLETAQWYRHTTWGILREHGYGLANIAGSADIYYTAFFGRGIMQLTWAGAYKAYGEYRAIPDHTGAYMERGSVPNRITATSLHYRYDPRPPTPPPPPNFQWSPRFDPDLISENSHYACDSGGFYWVSKPFSG